MSEISSASEVNRTQWTDDERMTLINLLRESGIKPHQVSTNLCHEAASHLDRGWDAIYQQFLTECREKILALYDKKRALPEETDDDDEPGPSSTGTHDVPTMTVSIDR